LRFGAPAPFELSVWDMAEKFGWTLEYIESLSMSKFHEYYQIRDAKAKARRK